MASPASSSSGWWAVTANRSPAPGVQPYCFRLCLTTASNRLPIEPPPDYDPARYEIIVRFIEACLANDDDPDLRWFCKHDRLPNRKYDFTTATVGGNLPGASWAWCEADHQGRRRLRQHEHYHRGLLHFLATDPRLPDKVRADMRRFGLPRDEFTDTGGWPHQLYVCEGRRIVKDGVVTREGKLAEGRGAPGPYGIGYRAILPKQAECDNLLVTFALSVSHVAFASIRMEPVFMVTSQSAAVGDRTKRRFRPPRPRPPRRASHRPHGRPTSRAPSPWPRSPAA